MRNYIKTILLVHLITYLSIGFNISILRQVFGFIYLTFIPGFIILKVLKRKEEKTIDTVLFSVGLSIAFSMFIGLIVNELYPIFGVLEPLSAVPLILTLSGLTLILLFVGYKQDLVSNDSRTNSISKSSAKGVPWWVLFLIIPPLLSVVGALYDNISVMLLTIVAIATLFAVSVFSSRAISTKSYPLAIFAISAALLFQTALVSKYFIGSEHLEYFVFNLAENTGVWNPPGMRILYSMTDNVNSLLSVTILPLVYSRVLNVSGELIFKLFYPFVFALVPLVLYRIYERQTGKLIAVLSAFFFVSSPNVFYGVGPIMMSRQIIGTLFLVFLIFLLIDETKTFGNKRILYMILSAALVVSHYSLAYIYLFYIVFTFILLYVKGREKIHDVAWVLLPVVLTFSWYIYVSDSPLNQLLNSFQHLIRWFGADMLSTEARVPSSFSSLSPFESTAFVGVIHRLLVYLQLFFIFTGIVILVVKPEKFNFHQKFRLMSLLSVFLLMIAFAVPNFAPILDMIRFYRITTLFLAPFFVLGGITIFSWVKKEGMVHFPKIKISSYRNFELQLLCIVLIASFLFDSGFVNHVTGAYPSSFSLDLQRKKTTEDISVRTDLYGYVIYIPEQDVFSARWLKENMNGTSSIYADAASGGALTAYALIPPERRHYPSNLTILNHNDYIYLIHLNTHEGVIRLSNGLHNISEISALFDNSNHVYTNGDSDVYWSP